MICQSGVPYTPGEPLPLQPCDVVFKISTYDFYEIKEKKVHGVAIYPDYCCVILDMDVFPIVKDCDPSKIDEVFFYTREDAELWKKKHLTEPPFILRECNQWVSPEQFLPGGNRYYRVYVRLQTAEGIVETKACYDDGSKYPEDKGFLDGTDRHSHKYENVIAWTGSKPDDPEE
jgi:hypothetical protein